MHKVISEMVENLIKCEKNAKQTMTIVASMGM